MPPALAHPAAPRRLHAPATSPRLQPASPSPAAAAPRRAAPCRLAAAAPQAPAQGAAEEGAEEGEWCAPAFVSVDNRKNPHFTVLEVEVQDYPGLMAVVAWVLNGLDTVAQNAVLSTAQDGLAHNTFWLSTRSGEPPAAASGSDARGSAAAAAQRMRRRGAAAKL
jgi:UTP:GlnB (protein PII) uridylyltransferase